jgi:8-oxo-dGTP diphosphatase
LAELQRVHETILGRAVNKDSFRRRMVASGMIEATGDFQEAAQHRPAELFRFRRPSAD